MKLRGNFFEELWDAVRRMGADSVDFDLNVEIGELSPIDVSLAEGLEVTLDDVDLRDGLLSYKGRQVLLYIQDQGGSIGDVLEDGSKGRKFHVSDCSTLEEMRRKGRFERYVATNDLTSEFFVSGHDWNSDKELEGVAQLKVCKNCLQKLYYQGYGLSGRKTTIFERFSLEEFFSTFSSFFNHLPKLFAGPAAKDHYTADWKIKAGEYKASRHYGCEACGLDLSKHRRLLHVHHKSGVKKDNSTSNLLALCIECHRKQPCHGHMFVSHEDRKILNELRRPQSGLKSRSWDQVEDDCDPCVASIVLRCRKDHLPMPWVAYPVIAGGEVVAELELAWPESRVGIAVKQEDANAAKSEGWEIWSMVEVLDDFNSFKSSVLRRKRHR